MTEPSIWPKIAVVSGFLVSFSATGWLFSLPVKSPEILPRLGFVSALICALGSLVFCWAVSLAYVARKRSWSPKNCYLAGLSIVIVALALSYFADPRVQRLSLALMVFLPNITGYLCRKLAYPELADEEATAPEPPLSLFPK